MNRPTAKTLGPATADTPSGPDGEARLEGDGSQTTAESATQFATSVLEGREPDVAMELIVARLRAMADASRASIATLEADGRTFCVEQVGADGRAAAPRWIPRRGSLYDQVLKTATLTSLADGGPRLVIPLFGTHYRGRVIELARPNGAPPFSHDEIRTIEGFTNAAAGTYIRSRDRASADRRLAAVMEVTQAILQGVELSEALRLVVRRARRLVGAAISSIYTSEPDGATLRCRAADGVLADELMRHSMPIAGSLTGQAMVTRRAINLPALGEGSYQPMSRLTNFGPTLFVPLGIGERAAGVMTMGNMAGGRAFTDEDLAVVQTFAAQAALCLGYASVREGVQQLGSPSSIERRSPAETFAALARTVVESTHSEAAAIFQLGADGNLQVMGEFGLPERFLSILDTAGRRGVPRAPLEALRTKTVSIRRVSELLTYIATHPGDPVLQETGAYLQKVTWDAVVGVPLIYQGRVVGALAGYYSKDYPVGDTEVGFLKIVASQAAPILEVARLFALAQQKAALEERQRLARELHDSVSQALYGIALGAQTAIDLLATDPSAVGEPLRYVHRLAEAGLAEMRALIFELRPESLEKEGLVAALRRLATLLRARYEIEVVEELGDEPDLSLESKEAAFRIAQEAMQNIARHSRASHVDVRLDSNGSQLILDITDNGTGFDATREFPGHLGLRSMRERASSLGGVVTVTSAPGEGTRVRVTVAENAIRKSAASQVPAATPVYRETFVHQIAGFYAEMAAGGHAVATKVLRLERMMPPAPIADRLKLASGDPIVHLLRLRVVDGRPNHIAETFLRSDRFPGLEAADLSQGSLYALLRERYAANLARSEVTVEAGAATLEQAMLLEIEVGAPVLVVKSIVHDPAGIALLFARSWHRAGESEVEFEVIASNG